MDTRGITTILIFFCPLALMFLVMFGMFLAIVFYVFVPKAKKQYADIIQSWSEFATRQGLDFAPGNLFQTPLVKGAFRGRPVKMNFYIPGGSEVRFTEITMTLNNPQDYYLSLLEKGHFDKIALALQAQDVQIGDPELDETFVIKSRPEWLASRVFASGGLRHRIRQELHIAQERGVFSRQRIWFRVQRDELRFLRLGTELDQQVLEQTFDVLAELADNVEAQNEPPG